VPPKNQTHRIDDLLGSVTEELLLGNPQQFEDNSIRVERLLLEMVRPDPVQPRRVLPEQLHFAFHSNRLTPTQALKELVQLVQVAARQRGDLSTMCWNYCLIQMMKGMKINRCISHSKNNSYTIW